MTTDATRRRRRPRPHGVVGASLALFLALLALLAGQLRSGHDPAIGAGPVLAQTPQTQPVVVRKVVRRVVIVRTGAERDDGAGGGTSAAQGTASSQPVVVQSAPAPAPAPTLATRAS